MYKEGRTSRSPKLLYYKTNNNTFNEDNLFSYIIIIAYNSSELTRSSETDTREVINNLIMSS